MRLLKQAVLRVIEAAGYSLVRSSVLASERAEASELRAASSNNLAPELAKMRTDLDETKRELSRVTQENMLLMKIVSELTIAKFEIVTMLESEHSAKQH